MAIDLKEAVKTAVDYLKATNLSSPQRIELEEIDSTEDNTDWLITIGFDSPNTTESSGLGTSLSFMGQNHIRKYKVIRINKESGVVISMKIRKI